LAAAQEAPATEFTMPSGHVPATELAKGSYECTPATEGGPTSGAAPAPATTEAAITFAITGDDAYEFTGPERQPGTFAFDAASGTVTWTSGPLGAPAGATGTVAGVALIRQSDQKPIIAVRRPGAAPGAPYEYCALADG